MPTRQKLFGENVKYNIEVVAGITTFLTMAYIIFVNPIILSASGMDKSALIAVTCLVSGVATILTGLIANAPIAMAPGMGLNAFFAYTLVLTQKVSWQTALGIVFISGFVFLVLTVIGFRKKIVEAIPRELLNAIAVGIGVFIAFIGLQNLGLVIKHDVTMVSGGPINPTVLIGLAGLLTMVILEIKKVKGSLLIGIFLSTILSIIFKLTPLPDKIISFNVNILPIFGKLDIIGALKFGFIVPIFTLMFMDMFDSIGTLIACAQEANMVDEQGKIQKLGRLLNLDAIATMFGAVCGTSTTTSYIESAAGVSSGGRTGFTSVTTGILFLISMLFVPLIAIVPSHATAPALIMVGFYMMKNIVNIDFKNLEIGFPSFIIIILIALSYSISTGLAFGFISYVLIKTFKGEIKQIKITMWVIVLLSLIYFLM